jgi:hypothetical protein
VKIVLFIVGVLAGALGGLVMKVSTNAVQEIEGMILILIGMVGVGSATITDAVQRNGSAILEELMRANAIAKLDRDDRRKTGMTDEVAKVRAEMRSDGRKVIDD